MLVLQQILSSTLCYLHVEITGLPYHYSKFNYIKLTKRSYLSSPAYTRAYMYTNIVNKKKESLLNKWTRLHTNVPEIVFLHIIIYYGVGMSHVYTVRSRGVSLCLDIKVYIHGVFDRSNFITPKGCFRREIFLCALLAGTLTMVIRNICLQIDTT